MGIFGSKKSNKIEAGKAAETSSQLKMSEITAAIATALELYGGRSATVVTTTMRSNYSPWRDIKRARAMERL
ncbi:MAG: hypothetical protein MUC95_10500 [Spirochaetes bacterium]|jgi:hypothetical protein|nr:hypothetical protein [Spirochaetota bacterium]